MTAPTYPEDIFFFHQICNLRELAETTSEFLNEADSIELGKDAVTTNDGVQFSTSMTVKGDAYLEVMSMLGQSTLNKNGATTGVAIDAALQFGRTVEKKGSLIIYSGHA
ncbi:MAG: hypothetical protein HRU12_23700, partial [Phaeodactylibacter sp.]|nr:hypothetical protein [Phaeodactylibacter sp.]